MADKKLIVDDDYCNAMAKYFEKQGQNLDKMVHDYVAELQTIQRCGIRKGSVSDALVTYISYAKKMENKLGQVSQIAKNTTNQFLNKIDEKDQYLF